MTERTNASSILTCRLGCRLVSSLLPLSIYLSPSITSSASTYMAGRPRPSVVPLGCMPRQTQSLPTLVEIPLPLLLLTWRHIPVSLLLIHTWRRISMTTTTTMFNTIFHNQHLPLRRLPHLTIWNHWIPFQILIRTFCRCSFLTSNTFMLCLHHRHQRHLQVSELAIFFLTC